MNRACRKERIRHEAMPEESAQLTAAPAGAAGFLCSREEGFHEIINKAGRRKLADSGNCAARRGEMKRYETSASK